MSVCYSYVFLTFTKTQADNMSKKEELYEDRGVALNSKREL